MQKKTTKSTVQKSQVANHGISPEPSCGLPQQAMSLIQRLILPLAESTAKATSNEFESAIEDLARKYAWSPREMRVQSPDVVPSSGKDQWSALVDMFQPDDLVKFVHLVDDVSLDGQMPASKLREQCLDVYTVNSAVYSTRVPKIWAATTAEPRFQLICQVDDYASSEDGWVFRMLVEEFGWKLRAATKEGYNLTGWFDPIEESLYDAFAYWLPRLGLSSPGCFSEDSFSFVPGESSGAELIYLSR